MKITKIFNIKNIKSFIEGNLKYYYNKLVGLSPHIQEQVMWRIMQCKDDCIPKEACIHCGCDPEKKAFVIESCNEGKRFPDLMNEEDWNQYKKDNKITIE